MPRQRVTWSDVGLTALLVFVGLVGTGPAAADQDQSAPVLSYILVTAACLAVIGWRWRPTWTFSVTGVVTMIYIGLGYAYGPILFALAVTVYGLAARTAIRQVMSRVGALLAAAAMAVGAGAATGERGWEELVTVYAWVVVPAAVGVAAKVRRDARADVRTEQARRALSEERLRLAQEVHDVVGHGLAVIAMQAGVALRVLERDPAGVRASLEAIRDTSKEALDGLRAEVEALRDGAGGADAPLRPGPGLADLDRLAERIRSSGLPVALTVGADVDGLPAEVDQAAYRIVQEALTNVLRHGGTRASATVRVVRDADALRVEIVDSGRGATGRPCGGGHGIDGMRARAQALGGALHAAPRPDGGFAVRAIMPVGGTAPEV